MFIFAEISGKKGLGADNKDFNPTDQERQIGVSIVADQAGPRCHRDTEIVSLLFFRATWESFVGPIRILPSIQSTRKVMFTKVKIPIKRFFFILF
ncbi:hypothetical protein B9Z55_008864 [Caenorhabditis nigoni]|uniref:Uncharacterized protein n=1 Tax=Caenorhabditis nigoni TaxID=1611254 RepID=A0A2G5UQC1_9PELO|nr:hypothetical protein B9Z55_008864 [Caenorhabditis nigoni]